MLRDPEAVSACTSIAKLRARFLDEHFHMALVVDRGRLVATVEREDLPPRELDDRPARSIGVLAGRTVGPDALLQQVAAAMRRSARRRLAVVDADGLLLGLLCLKASGEGFCSHEGVSGRRDARRQDARTRLAVA
jgi:CBS-domain-containing membrane protein